MQLTKFILKFRILSLSKLAFIGLSFICTILLSSCAKQQFYPENPHNYQPTKPASQPKKVPKNFKLSGAIAVNNNGKGWNAALTWSQQGPNSYNIHLTGPLGAKSVTISKQGSNVVYQNGSKIIKAQDDSELFLKKTKINLPINNLYYWVRGIPAPGNITYSKKDKLDNYELISQDGFTIIYSQYITNRDGVNLPCKIKITKSHLTIKLIIKNWS